MMIDTHHHFVPDFYAKAIEEAGGDPSGWQVPEWSVQSSEASLSTNNATTAILSLTSPGAPVADSDQGSRKLARQANEYCAKVRDEKPQKFGFFAALPNLLDTEGSLTEIKYALDTLKADGVTLFTRYGKTNHYLEELNRRSAVVFIHPTHPVDTNRVNPKIFQPIIDYPHETTRTVLDLLSTRSRSRYPNCKVILSHAGGTLPWILPRVTLWRRGLSAQQTPDEITYENMMSDFRSFYFDLALSTSHEGLNLLLKTVDHDHICYGSDFPYPPPTCVSNFRADLESYPMDQEHRDKIYFKNALALIPRLQKGQV